MDTTGFQKFKLNKQILLAITNAGYSQPTPIQQKIIPLITSGHDVMGIAQTGTGKTAAFVLPLLMKIKYAQGDRPRALIIAPTRELVSQLHSEIEKLSKFTDLRTAAIYGGIGPTTQIELLKKGLDIIVATPGRFLDLYSRGDIPVKRLNTLVLDEADKMMDMGFMPQIRRILEVIPVKRQNILLSATMPPNVIKLSEEFLEYPQIAETSPSATTAATVKQYCYNVPNFKTKINLLRHLLLETESFKKVIVFVKTKKVADNIYKYLNRTVVGEIRIIHSNKSQNARINSMQDFKEGKVRILVSTDVSARGIDVSKVSHVINFEVPVIYEDYVHRIGRTGRASKTGIAITFFQQAEEYHLRKIERLINEKIEETSIPSVVEIEETPFEELQMMKRAIDKQRKFDDPSYQGAFHEKQGKRPKSKPIKKRHGKRRS